MPSLPSFQHDIDYESASVTGAETSMEGSDQSSQSMHGTVSVVEDCKQFRKHCLYKDTATPHPLRRSFLPHSVTSRTGSNVSSATSEGSPFPPLASAYREETPSPYVPAVALTSTPHTVQTKALGRSVSDETRTTFRKSTSHQRTKSGATDLGSSNNTGRERWQTPGQMSRSFSIGEMELDEVDVGTETDEADPVSYLISQETTRLTQSQPKTTKTSSFKHPLLSREDFPRGM